MTKVCSSFVALLFTSLLVPAAVKAEILHERIQQTLRLGERVDVARLMRISGFEARDLEVRSITVMAYSYVDNSRFQVLVSGLQTGNPVLMSRNSSRSLRVSPPPRTLLSDFDIVVTRGEVFIESITADVQRFYQPFPSGPGHYGPGDYRPGPQYPGPHRPGDYRPAPQRPGPQYPGPNRPGDYRPAPQRPGPQRPGPQRPGDYRPEPQRPGPQGPGPQRPGPQGPGPRPGRP